jgi:hypothetical protein
MTLAPLTLPTDTPLACAIQSCLSRTSYNEQKCQPLINALYTCCAQFYDTLHSTAGYKNLGGVERAGVKGSTACPLEEVVRRTMRRIEKEKEAEAESGVDAGKKA